MTAALAKHGEHQVRSTVHDFGHIRIARPRADETAETMATDHPVEIAIDRKPQCRQQIQRAQFRGFLTGGKVVHDADLTGKANFAVPLADLAGEKHQRSRS